MKLVQICTLLALGVSSQAFAADVSSSFNTSAEVRSTCKIGTTANNVNLGTINPMISSEADLSTFDYIQCTAGSTGVKVAFDEGQNASAGSTCDNPERRLKSQNGDYISYEINARVGFIGLPKPTGCGTENQLSMNTFYSSTMPEQITREVLLKKGQNLKLGTYTDTVGMTVTF